MQFDPLSTYNCRTDQVQSILIKEEEDKLQSKSLREVKEEDKFIKEEGATEDKFTSLISNSFNFVRF